MSRNRFKLHTPFEPAGDQVQAIERLVEGVEAGVAFQTLLSRLRSVRLEPGFQPSHKPSVLLRGLRELPLEFEAA